MCSEISLEKKRDRAASCVNLYSRRQRVLVMRQYPFSIVFVSVSASGKVVSSASLVVEYRVAREERLPVAIGS